MPDFENEHFDFENEHLLFENENLHFENKASPLHQLGIKKLINLNICLIFVAASKPYKAIQQSS